MDIRFDNRTAIVTGAGSGIGQAIAEGLAAAGAHVAIADLDEAAARRVAEAITAAGGKAFALKVDTADEASVKAMIADTETKAGALHLLVNNAGIGGAQAPVGEYPVEEWHKVIGINLHGVFYGMRHAIPRIEAAGGGAVLNVSSILGSVGFANVAPYVAAKHALVGLTKTAAMDYAQRGVRVNAIGPGFIRTPLIDANLDQDTQAAVAAMHPVGRMGTSGEVASLALYLLSDQASFVTGSYHLVDGGYTAQ